MDTAKDQYLHIRKAIVHMTFNKNFHEIHKILYSSIKICMFFL